MSSPNVLTQTIDRTHYIPSITNEVAAFCGYFEKGPIDTPIFITDINQFKFIFGRGIDLYFNDWYQVYNYLQYATGIWVTRIAGVASANASNDRLVSIGSKEEWEEIYPELETLGITFIAQTPGAWGNLLSVSIIEYDEWVENVELKDGIFAKDVYSFFEKGYAGICVFRKEKLVEHYYLTDETIYDINKESRYVYVKINNGVAKYISLLDANLGDDIIDLNTEITDLNFSQDLNRVYQTFAVELQSLLDLGAGTEIEIYDLNKGQEPPVPQDLMTDADLFENKKYYTFFGDKIIKLKNGGSAFPVDNDIQRSYDLLKSKVDYDIDIIIGNDKYNEAAIDVAEHRRDCIAFIGMPTSFVEYIKLGIGVWPATDLLTKKNFVFGPEWYAAYTQAAQVITTRDIKIKNKLDDSSLLEVKKYIEGLPQSQFVHFTMNVKKQYDGFSKKERAVNIAADTAGLKAQASLVTPWTTGAGLERGRIKNATEILLANEDINKYYKHGLNFIQNNHLMSQKTFYTKPSAFNRINVRSLFNHIEKQVEKLLRYYVFEENTYRIRGIIASTVKRYLEEVKANRGIDAGKVHVKGEGKEIIVDVYIKPTYVAEYIQLRMHNVGTETFTNVLSNSIG